MELTAYFTAEKHGAVLLIVMGIASILACCALWQTKSAFSGMIWPLLLFAAIELVIGGVVAWRTPAQVESLQAGIAQAKAPTVTAELTRMARVNENFRMVKMFEAAIIGAGILMACLLPAASTGHSIGLGMVLQGAVLFVFDAFAHHRAQAYVGWLQSI